MSRRAVRCAFTRHDRLFLCYYAHTCIVLWFMILSWFFEAVIFFSHTPHKTYISLLHGFDFLLVIASSLLDAMPAM